MNKDLIKKQSKWVDEFRWTMWIGTQKRQWTWKLMKSNCEEKYMRFPPHKEIFEKK